MESDASHRSPPAPFPGIPAGGASFLAARDFLAGTLAAWMLVSLTMGVLDAGYTYWSQAGRLFTERLLIETLLAYGGVALLASLGSTVLYRASPAGMRARLSAVGPVPVGLAAACAGYFLVYSGFYFYVSLIREESDLARFWSFASLSYGVLLAIVTALFGRWICRRLRGHVSSLSDLGDRARSAHRSAYLALPPVALGATLCLFLLARDSEISLAHGASPERARPFRNLVVIVMDTTRRDRLSVYGHDRPTTPTLERLAAEGTIFDGAVSPASTTLAAHSSLLTGMLPSQHGASMLAGRPLPAEIFTLQDACRGLGMQTAGFVANRVLRMETGMAEGFDHYDDMVDPELCQTALWDVVHNLQALAAAMFPPLQLDGQPHWIEDHQRGAGEQNERIFEWLEEHGERPFFLLVNYYDPHWPYLPPQEYLDAFAAPYDGPITGHLLRDDDLPDDYELNDRDHQHVFDRYDAEIAYLDREIGRLVAYLEERGLYDRTLLVVTSDHGEHLGEHGEYGHRGVYEETVGVPLLLRLPGTIPREARIDAPVQLTDVLPTVLDLAGLPGPEGINGRSLLPLLSRPDSFAGRVLFAEDYDNGPTVRKMARLDAVKLIKSFDGEDNEELFDLERDPGETTNLWPPVAGVPATAPASLAERLLHLIPPLRSGALGDALEHGGRLDRRGREALRDLGYL